MGMSAELTEQTKFRDSKTSLKCSSQLELRLNLTFTSGVWGARAASTIGTKWIASRQNIPFSTPLALPHTLDGVVLFVTSHD